MDDLGKGQAEVAGRKTVGAVSSLRERSGGFPLLGASEATGIGRDRK